MERAAFIGLGVMGYPMAGHLKSKGLDVRAFNRNPEVGKRWCLEHGGDEITSIADAVSDADYVMTCVGADPDLREIYLGEHGIIANARPGAILVDHTTASAAVARELAKAAAESKLQFIDAPVSGGQQGAQKGMLTIMCGGDETAFNKVAPVLQPLWPRGDPDGIGRRRANHQDGEPAGRCRDRSGPG